MKTILTGLRVNSELHLGHYLGVIKKLVALSNRYSKTGYEINLFIPDLHSIITPVDDDLQTNTLKNIKYFLASGLELNDHVHIYRQSRVPAHAELAWVLNCFATTGELSRMTQYKDKSAGKTSVGVGIFDYPVLMAADILLYDAEYVPVGEDQFQHLELTRTLAERFNHRYGETFTLPLAPKQQVEFMNLEAGVRIRDLVNPEKKMSKSTPAENSKIMLSDSPEQVKKKIMSATTDSFGEIDFDFKTRPGISNLLVIESLLKDEPLETTLSRWRGTTRYGDLKASVAGTLAAFLSNLQSKAAEIPDADVLAIFPEGEAYANNLANQKLTKVYEKLGLR
ncbi:tryptophan--tRNA ligase [Candidatus Saccharibacteria bacterium]|nr:tryptophan--tRNA ligase [Candidatus Saccharibacteria bacterium]